MTAPPLAAVRAAAKVLAAAAALAVLAGCGGGGGTTSPQASQTTTPTATATASTPAVDVPLAETPPPWPAPVMHGDGIGYIRAAGLPALPKEADTVHYHAHLDVVVDGTRVTVPPYIGFAVTAKHKASISPLHTHDTSGVVHIEAPSDDVFTLGQFFVEWGVRFTAGCLGSFCAGHGKDLAVFVDGTRVTGDPTQVVLAKHQEIAIEYGATGHLPTPPPSYRFPNGL